MTGISFWAVPVAGTAAFLAAVAYYVAFSTTLAALGGARPDDTPSPAVVMPFELAKHLLLAAVVAGLAARAEILGWTTGALLGLVLWLGFPVVLLAGSVLHEKVPVRLAALHAGDWLVKLLLLGGIVGAWS